VVLLTSIMIATKLGILGVMAGILSLATALALQVCAYLCSEAEFRCSMLRLLTDAKR
jgi:hypothetical protein